MMFFWLCLCVGIYIHIYIYTHTHTHCMCACKMEKITIIMTQVIYSVAYQMLTSNRQSCSVSITYHFLAILIFILNVKLDFEYQVGWIPSLEGGSFVLDGHFI